MAKCPSPCTKNCDGACYVNTKKCTCWQEIADLDALLAPLATEGGEVRIFADSPGAAWLAAGVPASIQVENMREGDEDVIVIRSS